MNLVSIIIPTYNRAHLIRETLDSILSQTYTHWECIVVDDGSTDTTDALLDSYLQKEARITYIKRPKNVAKGANVCRNIGLTEANGDYIVFFDSDDIMTVDHIEVKVAAMLEYNCDYCITKTKTLNGEDTNPGHYYNFEDYQVTAHNYMLQHLNWLTLDTCIKSELAKSIRFNEQLKSGQEYNYYSKLVLKSTNVAFISKYVSLRRIHEGSIRNNLNKKLLKLEGAFYSYWETYKELHNKLPIVTKRHLLYKCVRILYQHGHFFVNDKPIFLQALKDHFSQARFNFKMMLFFKKHFNKGYYFRNRFKVQAFNDSES